jgi:hypothetical protein
MKKLLLSISILFFGISTRSQTLNWAKQIGNTTANFSNSIASDAAGNVYIWGTFQLSPDFDPGAGMQTLNSYANSEDVFLAKYDNTGNFLWVKQMGGTTSDRAIAMVVDLNGNAYCMGSFYGTATFGSETFTATDFGSQDTFITKIDASGNIIWAGQIAAQFSKSINIIGSDILISGNNYGSTIDFAFGAVVSNQTITGYVGQYLARYTTAGALVWAKVFSGPSGTYAQVSSGGIYVDASENIYVANKFGPTLDADPDDGTTILTATGPDFETAFFKLNSSGALIWAKKFGGSTGGFSGTVTADQAANIQVNSTFEGTVDMDPGPGVSNLTAVNYKAQFLSKFDPAGNFISTRKIDGPASASDYIYQLNSYYKSNGKNVIEFHISGNYDLGDGVYYYPSVNVIACYDASDNFLWKEVMPSATSGTFSESGSNILTVGTLTSFNYDVDPEGGPTHIQNMNNTNGSIFFRRSSIDPPIIPTAANMTWNGSLSTTWNIPDNWTPFGVPTAITNVTIPASLTNYPKMTGDSTINSINMITGSSLDFNGKKLTINSVNAYNYFVGATLDNTAVGTDIVLAINTGTGGYNTTFNSNIINDNCTFNLSGSNDFNEGTTGLKNTFNGNTTFNINGVTTFVYSHNVKSENNGDLTINRTVGGNTTLFKSGGAVSGNFSYTNLTSGTSSLGNNTNRTAIGGKVDININNIVPSGFGLYRFINQTTGGVISAQNTIGFEVLNDTLLVNSLAVTSYKTGGYGRFLENKISGNLTIADDATYTGGYDTRINHNEIGGDATFSNNGTNVFYDANETNKENNFAGNVNYTANNSGEINIGNQAKSTYGGNVTINRTASGNTLIFGKGANITGDFSYINLASGTSSLGHPANKTAINGKIDININNTTPSGFSLYRFLNQTAGGTISAQNTIGFDVINDTLLINSISVTSYKTGGYGRFLENRISGNVTIADDATYTGGYETRINHNEIGGDATFTNNGTNVFYEANETNKENNFAGNVSYAANNSGEINIGNQAKSTYGGNITINRTASGNTIIFGKGANITGNFSYSNLTSGTSSLGQSGNKTAIGGTVNINISNTAPSGFGLYRFVNQAAGGIINVQNTIGFEVINDTLLVNSLSLTDYQGNGYARFQENKISGSVNLADNASYTGGYDTRISHNEIGGNSSFTKNGNNVFYEANESNSQNKFDGDVFYTANNSGEINIGNQAKSSYGGNVTINRTASGNTIIFGKGANINGDFSFSNPTSGTSSLGHPANKTAIIGTVNIKIANTATSGFGLYRFVNQTAGGTISVENTIGFDVINDTLLVNSFSLTDYQGNGYARFQENKISGNVSLANNASYTGGYDTGIWHNEIGGDATFTNKGSNQMYDATNSNSGNKYLGNVTYNKEGGNITIATNSENEYGKGILFNSMSGITLNKAKFIGAENGMIEQFGTQPLLIPNINLDKLNTSKITLKDPLTVGTSLVFTSGKIETSLGNELIFPDNISYTGASDASFVEGPVKKVGNDAFVFPVGGNGKLATASISAPSSPTDEFRAQYIRAAPANPTLKEPSIDHLSASEYWLIDRPVGTSNVFVTLSWDAGRSGLVDNMTDLRIAHFDGGIWKNEGNGGTTGNNVSGAILSQLAIGSFSPFTLASVSANSNPLPLNLLNFSGENTSEGNQLNWLTANEVALNHFEIERSIDAKVFEKIGEVQANGGPSEKVNYDFVDQATSIGKVFYRLRMVDLDGKYKYSKIINIENNLDSELTIYPNPTSDYFSISGNTTFEKLQIVDSSGRIVKEFLTNDINKYSIRDLFKGVYHINIFNGNKILSKKILFENK